MYINYVVHNVYLCDHHGLVVRQKVLTMSLNLNLRPCKYNLAKKTSMVNHMSHNVNFMQFIFFINEEYDFLERP